MKLISKNEKAIEVHNVIVKSKTIERLSLAVIHIKRAHISQSKTKEKFNLFTHFL